jgi:hypothetical protein
MKAHLPSDIPSKVRKAINQELNRQTAQNIKNMSLNLQALVLYALHEKCGFGKKRLMEFQKDFLPLIEELQEYYQTENADETEFVCLYKLKNEVGIDVEKLDSMFKLEIKIKGA